VMNLVLVVSHGCLLCKSQFRHSRLHARRHSRPRSGRDCRRCCK
jgi:hypothetical protein